MTAVLHRDLLHRPARADYSSGGYLIDSGEGAVLDLSSGAGVTCLGHSAQTVKAAMQRQIQALPYAHAGNWTTNSVEKLAHKLLSLVGWPNGGVMFLNSGAESVEGACKLAAQYFTEKGYEWPVRWVARESSYHGNTVFTLALGDSARKGRYANMVSDEDAGRNIYRIPAFECTDDLEGHEEILRGVLASPILRATAVVIEPIGGTAIGIAPPTAEYLQMVRRQCDAVGALLIFDEVLCGNWRTGKPFAWQHYGVEPDIVTIGKGLTAGYFPLSAVIASPRVVEMLSKGSGTLWHSTTNQNHPVGCAAGLAAIAAYESYPVPDQIERLSQHIAEVVRPRLLELPYVAKVEGVGTLWGIRLLGLGVSFPRLREVALSHGVAIYVENQTGGRNQTSILLAPPYCLSTSQVDAGIDSLIHALEECRTCEELI